MRTAVILLASLTLVACSKDNDKDGFTSDVDCNDNNPEVYPEAPEICNDIDDDCDGTVDNDAGDTWYLDADADGWGDADNTTSSCDEPSGYVDNADDCDDSDDRFYPGATEDDCTDANDYNCDGSSGYVDADDDGFAACEDCDDSRSDVSPGAEEVCDDVDNDCDNLVDGEDDEVTDAATWYIDYDGDSYGSDRFSEVNCNQPDGYVDNADDCDDARSESYPGADELCDGYDNDCDDEVDEDSSDRDTYWIDVDEDGYGDPDGALEACAKPDEYVENDQDCDDSRDDVNPAADEVCDDADNDCDDLVDDDDTDTLYVSSDIYYADADGDDYGDYGVFELSCVPTDGYVSTPGDCDDDDSDVNPTATETCDGIDNNCTGGIDEDSAEDALTWYLDADDDDFGVPDATTMSCEQPSGYAETADDCDDDDDGINPEATEVCNDGVDNDCDEDFLGCELTLSDADVILYGEAPLDDAGISFTGLGDIDGDGVGDFMVGARDNDEVATDAGAAYLYMGPISAGTLASLADADLKINGADSSDRLGRHMSGGYDVDGDGLLDAVVSASNDEAGGNASGAVYIFNNASLLGGSDLSPADAVTTILGESTYDYLGVRVGVADMTGDGVADVLASGNGDDQGGSNSGAIYVLAGPVAAGTIDLGSGSPWDAKVYGETSSDGIGQSLSFAGDFDGDGTNDLVVGVGSDGTVGTSAGAAYIVSGPLSGDLSLGDADAKILSIAVSSEFGNSVSFMGDQDGDGYDEVAVASVLDDTVGAEAGAVYVIGGVADATTLDAASVDTTTLATLLGPSTGYQFGNKVAGLGDFDDDGTNDLAVAATSGGSISQGYTYLFTGPVAGSLTIDDAYAAIAGENADDAAGSPVGWMGDVTGDGHDVLGISAIANDRAGTDAGTFYMIYELGL